MSDTVKRLIVLAALLPTVVNAQVYDYGYGSFNDDLYVQPKLHDFTPGDGFIEQGTRNNPYVIRNSTGHTLGTIQPKYHDFTPGDGFMDVGTAQNPYVIERR